jgi:asparagine synthase (glutamine-hydrolysing)
MTIMPGVEEPLNALTDHQSWLVLPDITQRMMFLDQVSYLPGDNQTKVDRASMAVSLEQRAPILDHRVAEFAWHLPLDMKIRNGTGKWLLRQVLKKYVPDELINRPKMGFAVPLDSWLRGPLRDWAENCLDARRLREEGFFDPMPIRSKWEEHLAGQRNWSYPLWDILMFQAWLETSEETRALI